MKLLRTSLKNNKKYLEFLLFFFLFGFLLGFLIYMKIDHANVLEEIKSISQYLSANHINYIGFHFILISVFITCSLTILGIFIFPIYFIFEGACIFYHIITFTSVYHLSGFIYSILSNFLMKGLFLIFLVLLFKTVLNIVKIIVVSMQNDKNNMKVVLIKNIKRAILAIFAIFLNDIFLYFFGSKILYSLLFLIE